MLASIKGVVVSWPATVDVSVTAEVNSVIMVTQCQTISHGISVSPLLVVKGLMRLVVVALVAVALVAVLVTERVAKLEAIAATIVWLCG